MAASLFTGAERKSFEGKKARLPGIDPGDRDQILRGNRNTEKQLQVSALSLHEKVEQCLRQIRSDDPASVQKARDELVKLGKEDPGVVKELLSLITDNGADVVMRGRAATMLGSLPLSESEKGAVADAMIETLASINDPMMKVIIGPAILDALGSIGTGKEEVIDRLLEYAAKGDETLREAALRSLEKIGGERVFNGLIKMCERGLVSRGLSEPILDCIMKLAVSQEDQKRVADVILAGSSIFNEGQSIKALETLSGKAELKAHIQSRLLETVAEKEKEKTHKSALRALLAIGINDEKAAELLISLANSSTDTDVQELALKCAVRLGDKAVDLVIDFFKKNESGRSAAASALGESASAHAADFLIEALEGDTEADSPFRNEAYRALGKLVPALNSEELTEQAIDVLLRSMAGHRRNIGLNTTICGALANIGNPGIDALVRVASGEDDHIGEDFGVLSCALRALGGEGSDRAVSALIDIAEGNKWSGSLRARIEAARVLVSKLGRREGIDQLVDCMSKLDDSREGLALRLSEITQTLIAIEDKELKTYTIERLRQALKEKLKDDPVLTRAAAEAELLIRIFSGVT